MSPLNGFDLPSYLYGIVMGWILGFICGLGGNKMTNSEVKRSIEAEQKAIKRCEQVRLEAIRATRLEMRDHDKEA